MTERPKSRAIKTDAVIKIDGLLNDSVWQTTNVLTDFTELRPTPFKKEALANRTETYLLYSNEGIYFAGHCYENTSDSLTKELIGRDGFGNNDFVALIFDTYNDQINGFEYFVTPLGEQMDAKVTSNGEDFSWNAVWQSAAKVHDKGWDFEMFIPYAAIRFGKAEEQKWGLNISRMRIRTGQQTFWASIHPNINGFLTQEGYWEGIKDIKPPMRLQISPYISFYSTVFSKVNPGEKKVVNQVNGGMDLKYGINQAFTLDMTLIPDFGQVQTDNRVLNLGPFEQQYNEQRPFFTEGLELFSKGDLFYSRRIGKNPYQASYNYLNVNNEEEIIKDPQETKVLNASKISGRMQSGLAIGALNALTNTQRATIKNTSTNETYQVQNYPLTNYNMLVLDQTLKNNSSVSFVNTNVWRSGKQYDANVAMGLFNLFDKSNTWNFGGKAGVSSLIGALENNGTQNGYIHSFYFGKQSGRFNFNIFNDLTNDRYSQNDMGYATNNNFNNTGFYAGYNWIEPKSFYNNLGGNINGYTSYLVKAVDPLRQKNHMYQERFLAVNFYGQTKKLWNFYTNMNVRDDQNDYYEARTTGRLFVRKGRFNNYYSINSNRAKKYSIGIGAGYQVGTQFSTTRSMSADINQKIRFNQKFSIEHSLTLDKAFSQAGYGKRIVTENIADSIFFTRRNRTFVENNFNIKYSFTNKMWINLFVRHYWSGVHVKDVYLLEANGTLSQTDRIESNSLNQNFNTFAYNLTYTYQVANGSFLTIVWKDEAEDFNRGEYIKDYYTNLDRTFSAVQTNSVSVRFIYFIDYFTTVNKFKRKPKTS
jgi:hypothetical protein